ncbi:ATP-binding protein, partial [Patescibacteria group bacterium]
GYCVGLGNEGEGMLIIGVDNNGNIVGTNTLLDLNRVKKQIFNETGQKIEIEEIFEDEKKVIVIKIPSRQKGNLFKFSGVPLMRVGESLEVMSDDVQRRILLEQDSDFSAQIVSGATEDDLDIEALEVFQNLFNTRNDTNVHWKDLLSDLGLKVGEEITYAGLILLGKSSALKKYLANAEIIFQYRNDKDNIEYDDRIDYRNAFLLVQNNLWEKINSRNQITQIQEGFLTKEVPFFNEKVIKESILNAISHRDYRDQGSVIIKQSTQEIEIQSPGGFLPGITIENILHTTKTRNRLIAEALQYLGFVQRAGQGMDTIFQETIREGKEKPDLSLSDRYHVVIKISAQVKNREFLKFLERIINEKQIKLSLDDIVLLQEIEEGKKNFKNKEVQKFLESGIVEKIGKTRGIRYILSHNYYKSQGKTGKYTRLAGLSRDTKKQLIVEHLSRNEKAILSDFKQAFSDMKQQDISNILQELKRDGRIVNVGSTRSAVWKLNNKFDI